MSTYIVVVDDEPDVESMFRQHFRRELRSGRFVMEFALSAPAGLEQVKAIPDPSLISILSDTNMPGMTGLEMLPKVKGGTSKRSCHYDYRLWGRCDQKESYRTRSSRVAPKAHRLWLVTPRNRSAVGRVSLGLLLTDFVAKVGFERWMLVSRLAEGDRL